MAIRFLHRQPPRWISLGLLSLVVLAGCAPTQQAILPEDGPTMLQIYQQHMQRANRTSLDAARSRLASDATVGAKSDASTPAQSARGPDNEQHPTTSAYVCAVHRGAADLAGYTRSASREDQALFPRLANPTLVMYIFPHLAAGGVGVPGYATSFPMYTHVIYALPGERSAP